MTKVIAFHQLVVVIYSTRLFGVVYDNRWLHYFLNTILPSLFNIHRLVVVICAHHQDCALILPSEYHDLVIRLEE